MAIVRRATHRNGKVSERNMTQMGGRVDATDGSANPGADLLGFWRVRQVVTSKSVLGKRRARPAPLAICARELSTGANGEAPSVFRRQRTVTRLVTAHTLKTCGAAQPQCGRSHQKQCPSAKAANEGRGESANRREQLSRERLLFAAHIASSERAPFTKRGPGDDCRPRASWDPRVEAPRSTIAAADRAAEELALVVAMTPSCGDPSAPACAVAPERMREVRAPRRRRSRWEVDPQFRVRLNRALSKHSVGRLEAFDSEANQFVHPRECFQYAKASGKAVIRRVEGLRLRAAAKERACARADAKARRLMERLERCDSIAAMQFARLVARASMQMDGQQSANDVLRPSLRREQAARATRCRGKLSRARVLPLRREMLASGVFPASSEPAWHPLPLRSSVATPLSAHRVDSRHCSVWRVPEIQARRANTAPDIRPAKFCCPWPLPPCVQASSHIRREHRCE